METLTTREAFEAMRSYLQQFNEREPPHRREPIELLLQWTEVQADGTTSDPAQWDDWLNAVTDARQRLNMS
jgi:hypothetical protein